MRILQAALLFLMPATSVAAAPPLQVLTDWVGGKWQVATTDSRPGAQICLASPESMLAGGRTSSGCTYAVIQDEPDRATVTYRCPHGRQGRTTVRRDAHDIYTVDAQGVAHGLPFGDRAEWRRVGPC